MSSIPIEQTPDAPEVAYLFTYPLTAGNDILVTNQLFHDWTDGPSSICDGWTASGSGHVVLACGGLAGPYRSRIIGAAGVYRYQRYTITDETRLTKMRGRYIRLGAKMSCDTANDSYVEVRYQARDSSTWVSAVTAAQTAADSNDWIPTAAAYIPRDATAVQLQAVIYDSTSNLYVDSVRLQYGDSDMAAPTEPPDSTTCTCLCIADHNLGSANLSISLEGCDNGQSWSTVATITPTDDKPAATFFNSTTYKYWRVKIGTASDGTGKGSTRAEIGVILAGQYLEMPRYIDTGFDPAKAPYRTEIAQTRNGTPMGSSPRPQPIDQKMRFTYVTDAFLSSTSVPGWPDFKEHAGYASDGSGGKPFFFVWDSGNHADEVWFCWLKPGYVISEPRMAGLACKTLNLDVQVMQQ